MSYGRVAIQYDLAGINIPANATITEATLSLYRTDRFIVWNFQFEAMVKVFEITREWDNYDKWSTLSDGYDSLSPLDSTSFLDGDYIWYDFDVTESVKRHLADPSTNNGFMFLCEIEILDNASGHISDMASSEYSTVENRPKLTITYSTDDVGIASAKESVEPLTVQASNNRIVLQGVQEKHVELNLYSLHGRKLRTLNGSIGADGLFSADLTNIASGGYILNVRTDNYNVNRTLLVP